MFCDEHVNYNEDIVTRFPGCGDVAHNECYEARRFVRRISSCPTCTPNIAIADDYGDCINMAGLQLEEYTRRNMEVAAGMRAADYTFNDQLAHAAQLVALDSMTDAQRVIAVVSAATPDRTRGLRPWLPHMTAEESLLTQEMLKTHTRPVDLGRRGVTSVAILNAGVSLDGLLDWNYTLGEIRDMGFTLITLVTLGFRAMHLKRSAVVSVHNMRAVFNCTFEDVLQIERKYFSRYGALLSYASVGLDYEAHTTLGLSNLNALRPHGLNRLALLVFAESLEFASLRLLGVDAAMLREFDMLNDDDLRAIGRQPPDAVAAALHIPLDDVRRRTPQPAPVVQPPVQPYHQPLPMPAPQAAHRAQFRVPVGYRPPAPAQLAAQSRALAQQPPVQQPRAPAPRPNLGAALVAALRIVDNDE